MPERTRSSDPAEKIEAGFESDDLHAARGKSRNPEKGPLKEGGGPTPVDSPSSGGAKEDVPARIEEGEHEQRTGES